MNNVVKKKQKTLFAKIIGTIRAEYMPCLQGDNTLDDFFSDADTAAIALRRNELRTEKHGNSEAEVVFKKIGTGI